MEGKLSATKAQAFWETAEATNNGVLGGFGHLNAFDARDSCQFFEKVIKQQQLVHPMARALDVGAGIGRVTEEVLLRYFSQVDLVEQNAAFVEKARERLTPTGKLGEIYCQSLQDFAVTSATFHDIHYDVIWIQWVLNYLTDTELMDFLKACQRMLAPSGILLIKENVTRSHHQTDDLFSDDVYDEEDGSVTRGDAHFEHIFKNAGCTVISSAFQRSFPAAIFPVKMFALTL